MASLRSLIAERTDLDAPDAEALQDLVGSWSLIADLAMSDLVLWLPTWNEGGFVAGAQVRPATAATAVPEDLIATFIPRGRRPLVDTALRAMRSEVDGVLAAVAVPGTGGRRIAVVERRPSPGPGPTASNAQVAELLLGMVADGGFPGPGPVAEPAGDAPRVGDGTVRLDGAGRVVHASPNAVSAFHRLGLATPLVGTDLARIAVRLSHRPGPVDEGLALVAGGRIAGTAEIVNAQSAVTVRSVPLRERGHAVGSLVLVRDVADLRDRDRALLSKDAALREVHHRVKNNLQTVAALLRLQARRVDQPEAAEALGEAGRRVAAIAAVHEVLAGEPGTAVDFDGVVDRLVVLGRDLSPAHAHGEPGPHIERRGGLGVIPTDIASPLAMAVSELLSNAVSHGNADRIWVEAQSLGPAGARVAVCDDGGGIDPTAAEGLGSQIVTMLVGEDLRGTVTWSALTPGQDRPGTRVEIVVPVE